MRSLDELAKTYLLVRIDDASRLLQRAPDRDVAFEAIVIDHLNERYGFLGIEVIDCELTDNAHGSIAHHVRELLPCAPGDDWWQGHAAPDAAMVERGAKALFPRLMHYDKVNWDTCREEERELIRDDARAVLAAALGTEDGE